MVPLHSGQNIFDKFCLNKEKSLTNFLCQFEYIKPKTGNVSIFAIPYGFNDNENSYKTICKDEGNVFENYLMKPFLFCNELGNVVHCVGNVKFLVDLPTCFQMVSVKCDDRNMLTEDDVQIDKLQTQLVLSGNAVQSYDKKYFWIPCSLGVMVGIIQLIWYCVYKKCKKDSQYTLIIIFLTLVLLNPIFSIFQLINVPLSIILFECVDFFTFEFTSLLLIWILDEMFPKYSNNNCKLPKVGITASFWLVIVIWFLVSFGTSVLYCINYHSSFLLIKQHPLSFGTTASLIAISFLNHSNTISDSYIAIEILFRLCLIPIPIVYSRFAYHCFRLIRQTVYGFILVYNERKQEDNSSKTTYSNTQRCFPCKKQNEDNEIPRNEKEQEVDKEKEIDKQPTLDDIEKEADDWFSNEDNPFSREDDPFSSEDDPFSEKNDEKKKKQMSEEEKKGIFTNLDSQIIPEPLPKPANKSAGQ